MSLILNRGARNTHVLIVFATNGAAVNGVWPAGKNVATNQTKRIAKRFI